MVAFFHTHSTSINVCHVSSQTILLGSKSVSLGFFAPSFFFSLLFPYPGYYPLFFEGIILSDRFLIIFCFQPLIRRSC